MGGGGTNRFIISAADENKHILIHIPRPTSMERCNVLLFTLRWGTGAVWTPPSGRFRTKGCMWLQDNVGLIQILMEPSCADVLHKNRNPRVHSGWLKSAEPSWTQLNPVEPSRTQTNPAEPSRTQPSTQVYRTKNIQLFVSRGRAAVSIHGNKSLFHGGFREEPMKRLKSATSVTSVCFGPRRGQSVPRPIKWSGWNWLRYENLSSKQISDEMSAGKCYVPKQYPPPPWLITPPD